MKTLKIVKIKIKDLNTEDIEQAMKMIEGTARSMGIEVVEKKSDIKEYSQGIAEDKKVEPIKEENK